MTQAWRTTVAARMVVILVVAVTTLVIMSVWLLMAGRPLGWDEAVYASQARTLAVGTPNASWAIYRSPLLPLVAAPGLLFGADDTVLRSFGVAAGVLAMLALVGTGHLMLSASAGAWAALVAVTSTEFLAASTSFLTDLLSAAVLIVIVGVVWRAVSGERLSGRWAVAAVLLAGTAFYLRHGSIVPLAVLALTSAWTWRHQFRRSWPLAAALVTGFALLLVPHLAMASEVTGSPLGALIAARAAADSMAPIDSVVATIWWIPARVAGPVGGVLIAVALVHSVLVARRVVRRDQDVSRRDQACLFLSTNAVMSMVVIVATSHAEPRYVLYGVLLLVLAGTSVVGGWWGIEVRPRLVHRPRLLRWASFGAALGIASCVALAGLTGARLFVSYRTSATTEGVVRAVGRVLAAREPDCSVLSSAVPQLTWYSGCLTLGFGDPPQPGREGLMSGRHRYVVFLWYREERGDPIGDVRRYYTRLATDRIVAPGAAEIYVLPSD